MSGMSRRSSHVSDYRAAQYYRYITKDLLFISIQPSKRLITYLIQHCAKTLNVSYHRINEMQQSHVALSLKIFILFSYLELVFIFVL